MMQNTYSSSAVPAHRPHGILRDDRGDGGRIKANVEQRFRSIEVRRFKGRCLTRNLGRGSHKQGKGDGERSAQARHCCESSIRLFKTQLKTKRRKKQQPVFHAINIWKKRQDQAAICEIRKKEPLGSARSCVSTVALFEQENANSGAARLLLVEWVQ